METIVAIRHKLRDFETWLPHFKASHDMVREAGGIDFKVYHSLDDPNDILLLIKFTGMEKAQKFIESEELRDAMTAAGVIGIPDIQFFSDGIEGKI